MVRILLVLSGSDHWTLNDGTRHPTGYWAEEFVCRTAPPQAGCRGTRRYAGRVGGKRKAAGLRNYIESIEPELAQPMAVEPGQPAGRQLAVPGQANDGVH
jgi:hypothetical protein